jgi:hypothetical protein
MSENTEADWPAEWRSERLQLAAMSIIESGAYSLIGRDIYSEAAELLRRLLSEWYRGEKKMRTTAEAERIIRKVAARPCG